MWADQLPSESNFQQKMHDAGGLLNAPPDALISIKIKPVNHHREYGFQETIGHFGEERLRHEFGPDIVVKDIGQGMLGHIYLLKSSDGDSFLFVEHETGPEIITFLGIIGAGAYAANQLLKLVNTVCHMVREYRGGRHHRDDLSIEKRLIRSQKVIKHVEKTVKASQKFITRLDDFLK